MKHLLIIDGLDGSGKKTISNTILDLINKSTNSTYNNSIVSFPRYEEESSHFVKEFLNGTLFEDHTKITPLTKSLLYTIDRRIFFETHPEIRDLDVLILDRSHISNIIYQTIGMDSEAFYKYMETTINVEIDMLKSLWSEEDLENGQAVKNTNIFILTHDNIETNLNLLNGRNTKKDIYESEDGFLKAVGSNITYLSYDAINNFFKEYDKKNKDVKGYDFIRKCFTWKRMLCSDKYGTVYAPLNIATRIMCDAGIN